MSTLPSPTSIDQHPFDERAALDRAIVAKTLLAVEASPRLHRRAAPLSPPAVSRAPKSARTVEAATPLGRGSDAPGQAKPWVDPFVDSFVDPFVE